MNGTYLLDGKMIDEHSNYRGQAEETWSVAFLLFFLACQAGLARAAPAVLRSFTLLKATCSELRVLRWRWLPLRDQEELQALSDLQRDHQQAFLVAHGAELLRPKHHYRFHLVDACLRLRCLSTVAAHEKKHRALKSSGLLDNQKKRLHSSLSLQESLLPRLLEKTIQGANDFGLFMWGIQNPYQKRPHAWANFLRDDSLQEAKSVQLLQRKVTRGDLLLWSAVGGRVEHCLEGERCGLFLVLQKLEKIRSEPFGSVWRLSDATCVWKPVVSEPWTTPSWWRFQDACIEKKRLRLIFPVKLSKCCFHWIRDALPMVGSSQGRKERSMPEIRRRVTNCTETRSTMANLPIGVSGHTPEQESLTQSTPTVGDRCLPDRGRYMFKPNGNYP